MQGFAALATLIRNHWKEATILVLLAVVNWYRAHPPAAPVVRTEYRTVANTTTTEKKDLKKSVVQTVKKKDGTQVVTQTQVVDLGTVESQESQDNTGTTEETAPSNEYDPPRYQLDVTTNPKDYHDWKVGVGARLGDLPAYGVIEYEPGAKTVRLGIRVEK